ncbi:MAG: hypothetical protein NTZ83_04780 [Candidatus Pacearchaeota archaeon]|nr:hypothetical protein [Candidatus Pacearchaeota archaeon]
MVNSKNAFWQALVVTIFVFIAGLVLGFYIELSNVNKSDLLIRGSEVDFLDQQIKVSSLSSDVNFNCENARRNLFEFADQIYVDATKFEEEDAQSKLTENQRDILHKRYDLLRVNLWLESLKLRNRCNESFHTLLYFFDYSSPDINIRSEQRILSLVLLDLKYKYPNEILLLPIAANMNLDSVDMIKENYNISRSPSLIIDESLVLDSLVTSDELKKEVFGKGDGGNDAGNDEKIIILKS